MGSSFVVLLANIFSMWFAIYISERCLHTIPYVAALSISVAHIYSYIVRYQYLFHLRRDLVLKSINFHIHNHSLLTFFHSNVAFLLCSSTNCKSKHWKFFYVMRIFECESFSFEPILGMMCVNFYSKQTGPLVPANFFFLASLNQVCDEAINYVHCR